MKIQPYFVLTSFLLAAVFTLPAHAGISLDRSIVHFAANEVPRKDITVSNQGSETAYVQVDVLEVKNPGTDQEERIPATNLDNILFVATPAKLAIPPGGRKQVRLVNLAPADNESVYRINFTPVLPPLSSNEGVGVKVIIAYQVLALIQPKDPKEELQITREGHKLTIHNKGNSYALISDIKQCIPDSDECNDDIAGTRLYAGNIYEIDLPHADNPVHLRVTNFKGARKDTIE